MKVLMFATLVTMVAAACASPNPNALGTMDAMAADSGDVPREPPIAVNLDVLDVPLALVTTDVMADAAQVPDVQPAAIDVQSPQDTPAVQVDVFTRPPGTCATTADCPAFPQWQCVVEASGVRMCACTPGVMAGACTAQDADCDGTADVLSSCHSGCANTLTDPANCGRCESACAGGELCSAGACACPTFARNLDACSFCTLHCLSFHTVPCPTMCCPAGWVTTYGCNG